MARATIVPAGKLPAFLLAAALTLFFGGLLSDYAYWTSYELQWSNFASWLLAGAMVFLGVALALLLADLIRFRRQRSPNYFLLLLATFVLGLIDALIHARDAWAVMPTGLVLSLVVTVLAAVATWLAFSGLSATAPAMRELP